MSFDRYKVLNIAKEEEGYLEKESNKNLNDKTANAGDNNYTKYGAYFGMNPAQWCDLFVDWCFVQAYGRENAKKLLGGFSAYTPTSSNYFKKMGRWYTANPEVGDVIFFKNNVRICHTGLVYKVENGVVYTREGNTSGASGVISNGGGAYHKSYKLNNSRIAGYGRPDYGDKTASTLKTYLSKGDTGNAVKTMQSKLIACGFRCGDYGADGDFGEDTEKALMKFQNGFGLEVDGKYGALSKAKLESVYAQKKAKKTTTTESAKLGPDVNIKGKYVTTMNCHMRDGAGKESPSMIVLPKGTLCRCYGFYSKVNGTNWLLVQAVLNDVKYTGFVSKNCLDK